MPSEGCVLITGAAGALGRAVVAHFAARGAGLVLLDRDGDALAALVSDRAGRDGAAAGRPTCSMPRAVRGSRRQAASRFGRIDVLCNIAGGFTMGEAVHETAAATWQRMLDLNVNTMLHACARGRAADARARRRQSSTSARSSAQRGAANMGAYIASKSAVMRLTESMAAELREDGINVNCVLPTIIDTPDNRQAMPDADPSRWVAPEALAAVIGFLASTMRARSTARRFRSPD